MFQSSPSRKAGCNKPMSQQQADDIVFQSSPSRKAGCNTLAASCLLRPPEGFNPHPAARLGATQRVTCWCTGGCTFQSSPSLAAGCNPSGPPPRPDSSAGFNPHPALRLGATRYGQPAAGGGGDGFQSSPSLAAGCNGDSEIFYLNNANLLETAVMPLIFGSPVRDAVRHASTNGVRKHERGSST